MSELEKVDNTSKPERCMAVFNDIVDLQTPGYLPYGGNLCVVLESDWGNLKVLGTAPLGS